MSDQIIPQENSPSQLPKLTPGLLRVLRMVVERDDKGTWSKRHARLQELNKLHKLGYAEPIDSEPDWTIYGRAPCVCYISTPAGRAALAANSDASDSASGGR